jgi:predicted permease
MSSQGLTGGSSELFLLIAICIAQYGVVTALSFPLARLVSPSAGNRGIYRNFLIVSNNGFMGFPVGLAMFGHIGMFYMVIINCIINLFIFTIGIWNVKKDVAAGMPRKAGDGGTVRHMLKDMINPPIVALLIGFFLMFTGIRLPEAVTDVLDTIGGMMAPLSMIVIGLQLTESKLGGIILNRRLIAMALIKLIGLGTLNFLVLFPFYMNGSLTPLLVGVLTLNVLLPCATVPVMLADEYGGNVKLAAEGTFLTTLFSMITIPIAGVLLTAL